jgi:pimeloyl-ACP methyl ester carboxylesterase
VRILAALLAVAPLADAASTPPFRDAAGRELQGSVASMEMASIGGIEQSLWLRGRDVRNPPLVLLHGGPGASEGALFRRYNAALEDHFIVAYWDQRGAGRSFHQGIPAESMTIERFLLDLDEVVDLVRRRFGHERVVLVGHSWGTVLGVLYARRHPDKVAAYVGVAQVVDMAQGARLSREFAIAEATRRDDRAALEALEDIAAPPRSVDERLALGRWVERLGGVFHAPLSTGKLIWSALQADEVGFADVVRFGRGNRFSLEALERETVALELPSRGSRFAMPVVFALGRHDHHVPSVLAAEWFARIESPCKRLVWFEGSAHNPPFEEPEAFNRLLSEIVRPAALDPACRAAGG